ncbi:MAG: hypothetical protein ABR990_11615 [Terracidiphilus sp.]
MRRFLTLVCLLCLAIPAGISISGCTRNPGANYCNGLGYGMKVTDVATLTLQPATTGISMAYGQTRQVSSPTALTCKGQQANAATFTYGTTNNQLVDITPGGNMCAGTWNRNSGGGIADYTICNPPNPSPSTGGLPYGVAYVTASAQSVVSNPVEVYVHAPVTSVSLVTTPTSGSAQQCFSQGAQALIDAQACYANSSNTQVLLCAPSSVTSNFACPLPAGVASVPNCTVAIGALNYAVGNPLVASVATNTTTNQVTITALQPGTTAITASVAGSGSSAGYFSTCPPASISVTLANGNTVGTITQGVTQNLTTTVYDNNLTACPGTGCPLTGLALTYQSTDPIDISSGGGGSITTSFPGVASIYAVCQPPSCNSAPINVVGIYGTGLPLTSNPVTVTTPGTASEYVWYAAPGQSEYVVPAELLTGTVGSTVRLPYVPNSMVMDRGGNTIYFGSSHELMSINTANNSLGSPNTAVPGVVLAVAPNNSEILINDQARQIFYLYNVSGGSYTAFGGMGNAAAWTPDSNTLYITDNAALNNAAEGITGHTDTLYVYSLSTGWTTYPLPPSPLQNQLPPGLLPPNAPPNPLPPNVAFSSTMQTPAVTVPSVGAYLRGSPTVDHTWCPTGTVGIYSSMVFYPQPIGDSLAVQSDALAATTDGHHIMSAAITAGGFELSDIGVAIPSVKLSSEISTPIPCPEVTNSGTGVETLSALPTGPWLNANPTLDPTKVAATSVNQVIPSPQSNLVFVTYTADAASTTAAQLPYYVPNSSAISSTTSAPGTLGYVPLTTQKGGVSPIAPLAGAFTPDDKLFFVSTAGDNMIHYISIPTTVSPATPPADTQQISPNLPACTPITFGGTDLGCVYSGPNPGTAIVPATAIAVKPRSTT